MDTDVETTAGGRDVWGPWATVGLGLIVGLLLVVVQLAAAAIFLAGALGTDPDLDVAAYLRGLVSDGLYLSIATLSTAVICTGFVYLAVRMRRGPSFSAYIGFNPVSKRNVLSVLLVTGCFIVVSDLIAHFLDRPVVPEVMVRAFESTRIRPLLWFAVVAAAPLFEEIFFRGFLFEGLRRSSIGGGGAVLVTALSWSVIHTQYGFYEITVIFCLGLILGCIRLRTGSVTSCIAVHAFNNLVATVGIELYIRGFGE